MAMAAGVAAGVGPSGEPGSAPTADSLKEARRLFVGLVEPRRAPGEGEEVGVGVGVGVRVTAKVKLRGFDEHWRADAQGTATARPLGKRRAQALGAAQAGRAADGRARPRGHGSVESRLGLARP